MRVRNQLHRRFLQTRDSTDWSHYKESRNFTKISLKNAAEKYTFDEVQKHKNNPSSLWMIVNQNIPSKDWESHVKSWKEQDDELKHIPTLGNFKRKLKSHLLDKFHLSS